ncbi:MAG TPA: capsular biosynthesis protein [Caulobacteraceae bacterium]|nr:capsular biosynthesis protein [Caulobacteraceae bacterium]
MSRAIMNGGDLVSWGVTDAVWPRAPSPLWRAWIEWRLREDRYTDIVVFGDAMVYSAQAVEAAKALGINAWVLENGYNRPDWITLEPGGVNAHSSLPREARDYDHVEVAASVDEPPRIGRITPYHVVNITSYFTGVVLGWLTFPTYRYPYAVRLWPQVFGHIRRFAVSVWRRRPWREAALNVLRQERPFFLACLQREGDSQLLSHSEVKTNRAFMARVVASFAAYSDPDAVLVFKNHPLDPGVDDLADACRAIATAHGVVERVVFLEGGAFAPLATAARGVVAVNSTAAYAAIGFGKPVKLLGRALFDIEGLVDRRSLDIFWQEPRAPDTALFARFRQRLTERTQIWGSFHNPRQLDGTAARVVERIVALEREPWYRAPSRPAIERSVVPFGDRRSAKA